MNNVSNSGNNVNLAFLPPIHPIARQLVVANILFDRAVSQVNNDPSHTVDSITNVAIINTTMDYGLNEQQQLHLYHVMHWAKNYTGHLPPEQRENLQKHINYYAGDRDLDISPLMEGTNYRSSLPSLSSIVPSFIKA